MHEPFDERAAERVRGPRSAEMLLAKVVSVNEAQQSGAVQVRLFGQSASSQEQATIWARVASPIAGAQRGTFWLPAIGDEVLVAFIGGDPRQPIVLGSLWNATEAPPRQESGEGGVAHWSWLSKHGTKISIREPQEGAAVVKLEVSGGVSAELNESDGGKLELKAPAGTITLDSQGITISTSGEVALEGSTITLRAGTLQVDTAQAKFSGVVNAETVIADSIVGANYTPGAGNVW